MPITPNVKSTPPIMVIRLKTLIKRIVVVDSVGFRFCDGLEYTYLRHAWMSNIIQEVS